VPRRPRRRRLSRRRKIRRITLGVVLGAIAIAGFVPTMHYFGLAPGKDDVVMTNEWKVVRVASDRSSVVIRVWSCAARFEHAEVMRDGKNVALAVFVRKQDVSGAVDCGGFGSMPTHVVRLGSMLAPGGHVLDSGCPKSLCEPR
jgi:hypothetical protein